MRTSTRIDLYNKDMFEVLPCIERGSVNLVIADLPYKKTNLHWDVEINLIDFWVNVSNVLAKNGTVILFGNHPFTAELVMSKLGWYKQALVWDKNKCGSPGLAKIRPMQVHEDILIFAPGRTVYNPIMEKGEPYARKSSSPDGYVGRCNNHGYGLKPKKEFENKGTRYPRSIVRVARDFSAQQQLHPTQKPVGIFEWLIRTYSNPGDVVLDPCMGVGGCGVAACKTGRHFIGIEKEHEYYAHAVKRCSLDTINEKP